MTRIIVTNTVTHFCKNLISFLKLHKVVLFCNCKTVAADFSHQLEIHWGHWGRHKTIYCCMCLCVCVLQKAITHKYTHLLLAKWWVAVTPQKRYNSLYICTQTDTGQQILKRGRERLLKVIIYIEYTLNKMMINTVGIRFNLLHKFLKKCFQNNKPCVCTHFTGKYSL
jgi:hypothetical protein